MTTLLCGVGFDSHDRLERAVHVRRERLELGRARVHALVDRPQVLGFAPLTNRTLCRAGGQRQFLITKSGALQPAQVGSLESIQTAIHCLLPHRRDLDELLQEPRVDLRNLVELLDRPAALDRAEQIPQAPIGGNRQPFTQADIVFLVHRRRSEQQTAAPELERAHALHERFLERPPDRHRLAHRLHLRRQRPIGLRELLEVPPRNLDDDVVDGGFEGGGREARDVVRDLVEVIPERELGGDFRNREPGGLRRERRRSRHARVHLDDDHPAVLGMHRELDVRPAGLDADAADDPARGVAHPLVFLVAEREDRRHRDAVAGVDAHRIDVLDGADDDEVVGDVAHHLELELFPADHRFLDEHLVHRAQLDPPLGELAELFDVVGDAAADAAQRERGTDHQRKAERPREVDGFGQVAREAALRHVEADLAHRVLEQEAILGHLDGLDRRANQLDVELFQDAGVRQINGQVQAGLAADRRQDRVGPLALDDRGEHFHRQRLDVGPIRELGVGHDRRRVAVDENDFEPLGAQRLARLAARVVELARLADDDRAGADDQNAFEIVRRA